MDYFEGDNEKALSRALSGGEDYELLFTIDPRHEEQIPKLAAKLGTELSLIGKVTAKGSGMKLAGEEGEQDLKPGGFDHFKPAAQ
jgi:thiamine-monophosphate kinase